MTKRIFISARITVKESQMKTKILSSTLLILIFLLTACGGGTTAPVTRTPVATQPPTDIPTQTAIPTLVIPPSPTAAPPYPTASVVKPNAVAFIAENALWVANVDGSGERKLTDITANKSSVSNLQLHWSPDGKWISYFSGDEVWIISPDGLINKKNLPFTNLYLYVWSPDSSKIAFNRLQEEKPLTIGILDIETGNFFEVSTHIGPDPMPLSWSPDGRYLLYTKINAFVLLDVTTHKIIREIQRASCGLGWNSWSPNGKWFFHSYNGSMCISGLDGSTQEIHENGGKAWDKTGNFLYIITTTNKSDGTPDTDVVPLLTRYEIATKKTEKLIPLEWDSQKDLWTLSLSPDGNSLALRGCTAYSTQCSFIIVDIPSLSISNKFTLDFTIELYYPYPAWSSDNRNIILFAHNYGYFYAVDTKTGKATIISGHHQVANGRVSPIATTP